MDLLKLAQINTLVIVGLMVLFLLLVAIWYFGTRKKGITVNHHKNDTELKQVIHIFIIFLHRVSG